MKGEGKQNRTKFGMIYQRLLGWLIPEYAAFSLIGCFALNMLVYSGTQFLLRNVEHYDLTTRLDKDVPFVPQWILIYLVCFLFWAINYILISREGRDAWYRFAAADMTSRIVCGIFFVLLPTCNVRPEVLGTDFCSQLVRLVYDMDLPVNLFPSIHCLVSWFCYIGIRGSKKIPKWYQWFSMIFAVLVFLSTQFTKQHYWFDIVGGVVLAEACFYLTRHTKYYLWIEKQYTKLQKLIFGEIKDEDDGGQEIHFFKKKKKMFLDHNSAVE